ncbi:MAG: T9SS type A sorting domain-containing protein [Bacteroidia bacterium]
MKAKTPFLIFLFFYSFSSYCQRYLNPVFPSVNYSLNISYGNAVNIFSVNQSLLLDFFEPFGDTVSKRPLILYLHGGGFNDTNQSRKLIHIKAFCDSFALRGYAVAAVDYRLDTGGSSLSNRAIINAMHDAKSAIRFFKANRLIYRIDTSKIFIGGESAGAITALSASYIDKINEVFYPPVAPYSSNTTIDGNSGNAGYSSKVKATLCFCGGNKTTAGNPVFDTTSINISSDPPVLIVHGTADPLIPTIAALNIAIRATHKNVPNLFYPLYGATHCPWFYPLSNSWQYLDTLVNYTSTFLYAVVSATTTGIKNSDQTFKLFSFPNPNSSEKLTLIIEPAPNKEIEIILTNSLGQVVLKDQINLIENKRNLDVSYLQNGIYFLQVKTKDRLNITQKIIISK